MEGDDVNSGRISPQLSQQITARLIEIGLPPNQGVAWEVQQMVCEGALLIVRRKGNKLLVRAVSKTIDGLEQAGML